MLKRLYILLLALMPLCAVAQQAVGSWTIHSPYSTVDKLLETQDRVYYTSSGSLFYFEKDTEISGCLNSTNGLNGATIADIFYNPYANYLLVVYTTGNMDKIYDSGKIINLPDISSAILTETPSVKTVAFGIDNFYVLTNFGLLNYDDNKNEVVSTLYTTDIQSVMCLADLVVVNLNQQLRHAPQGKRLTNVSDFQLFGTYENTMSKPVMVGTPSGIGYFADGTDNNFQIWKFTYNPETFAPKFERIMDGAGNAISKFYQMTANHNGSVSASHADWVYYFDADGAVTRIQLPAALKNSKVSIIETPASTWAAVTAGLGQYDITNPSAPVTLREPAPGSDLTVDDARYLTITPDNRIILSTRNRDDQEFGRGRNNDLMKCDVISGNKFESIAPVNANGTSAIRNPFRTVAAPQDPNTYFTACWLNGVYRFSDKTVTGNWRNPAFMSNYLVDIFFDNKANLWAVLSNANSPQNDNVYCLSADKVLNETINNDDWIHIKNSMRMGQATRSLACKKKSNLVILTMSNYNDRWLIIDNKNNTDPTDDEVVAISSFEDQDGFTYGGIWVGEIQEDNNGKVWIACNLGILELATTDFNTIKANAPVLKVNRLKVPRNDGTNLADYLANGDMVSGIAVDAANNKWLSTHNSGLMYVSERGDAVIEQFTAENSPLPTNNLNAVQVDPTSNSVWIATNPTLIEYSATAAPAAADYSDVYAYPNPVRPDYTGWITVTGLMDNSLVKIADAAGNVFSTGTSNGGMYVWDGCNAAGDRVPSGVYYVFASQSGESSSSGAVTKILVVN